MYNDLYILDAIRYAFEADDPVVYAWIIQLMDLYPTQFQRIFDTFYSNEVLI